MILRESAQKPSVIRPGRKRSSVIFCTSAPELITEPKKKSVTLTVSSRLLTGAVFLKASQPDNFSGSQLEEHRRPRHSGALQADGALGRWTYGASLAYVGSRLDREEVGNRAIVRLSPYWLTSARVAYALTPALQLFVRGSNLLDDRYEDSAGYRTEGRGLFVGISLREDRRSSP